MVEIAAIVKLCYMLERLDRSVVLLFTNNRSKNQLNRDNQQERLIT